MPVYKDKTTGTYYTRFYYYDHTGTRRQKHKRGFQLQREAKEWERSFLEKHSGSPSMTFASMSALFLEDKKTNNKLISYQTRKNRIDNWILPTFGSKAIETITPADIRKWQNDLKNAKKKDGSPYSPAYLNNIVLECSEVFNYAVRFYGLRSNPIKIAGNTAGHKVKRIDFWTQEEFKTFIDTFAPEDPYKTLFIVLYYTGMREGELLALTPADIDYDAGMITVNKTYHMIAGKDVVTPPKTAKANRCVTMPPFLADVLKTHQTRLYGIRQHDRLFPYADTTIDRKMREHTKIAGLKKLTVHGLRHSHASLLIELGFSALLVAERLGHENVSTTLNTYSHLFPSKQSEVADRLQRLHDAGTKTVLKNE